MLLFFLLLLFQLALSCLAGKGQNIGLNQINLIKLKLEINSEKSDTRKRQSQEQKVCGSSS